MDGSYSGRLSTTKAVRRVTSGWCSAVPVRRIPVFSGATSNQTALFQGDECSQARLYFENPKAIHKGGSYEQY